MRVVVVACTETGDVDLGDLRKKIDEHAAALAAIMVTYPSTHGVFEHDIVELCGAVGYSEGELLEKWARDSKILDIFEGTQQIQQLIVARRVLGLSSAELK